MSGVIKNWPKSERPRELLLEKGPEYVSDAGLIAIILRTGTRGKDAVSLGRELLERFSGLNGLLNASRRELEKINGLGPAKIAQLLASIEIAKRQLYEETIGRTIINGPSDVIDYLSLSMSGLKEEVFKVLYLNSANEILSAETLFKGTTNQSAVYPREVIKRALELSSTGVIFVHNHPSGNLKPSRNDIALNKKLIDACRSVDITPLDHFIIGQNGYTSFKEEGLI
ncbi:MAG: DNA repair protein RadC [Thermodesulfovibrionales bacterium]